MSAVADVVRGALCVGILAGLCALAVRLPFFFWAWWELVSPAVASALGAAAWARVYLGALLVRVGLWVGGGRLLRGLGFGCSEGAAN